MGEGPGKRVMSPWSLRFCDPAVERAYGDFDPQGELGPHKALVGAAAAFMIGDGLFHGLAMGFLANPFLISEVALGLGLLGTNALLRVKWIVDRRRTLTIFGALLFLAGMTFVMSRAPDATARPLFATAILFMLANTLLAYAWRAKVATNLVAAIGGTYLVSQSPAYHAVDVYVVRNLYIFALFLTMAVAYVQERDRRRRFLAERDAEVERARSEELLHNTLPEPIVRRLKALQPGGRLVDRDTAAVLFADIVGFTPFAAHRSADEVIETLDRLFASFDAICQQEGLEKIKTIGDAYMAIAGLPEPHADAAGATARAALKMIDAVAKMHPAGAAPFEVRIGLHIGPVVAGVIGKSRFLYDLWGDTVNIASRLESTGVPGRVQISPEMVDALGDRFEVELRGRILLKGRGEMDAYFVKAA